MLDRIYKGLCAAALAMSVAAPPAHAETVSVLIVDGGYFPAIVHVNEGDTLVFSNASSDTHVVAGPDEAWVSEPIPVDGSFSMELTAETPPTFHGTSSNDTEIYGEIAFADSLSGD